MIEKLSERDKRALKIGAVAAVAILVFYFGAKWVGDWREVRKSLAVKRAKLEVINMDKAKRVGLLSIVPVFEMPQSEEKQKFLFRDKFNEQLKKAGIKSKPLQVLSPMKLKGQSEYKLLRLKCSGKCNFGQVLDLLANLKDNPYLVGIEEFKISCNPEKRKEFQLDLTVSTFVK